MSKSHDNIETHETQSKKFTHLTIEERRTIQFHRDNGKSYGFIANELGRSKNTIWKEVQRGTIDQIISGKKVTKYYADVGERVYLLNRENSKGQPVDYSQKFLEALDTELLTGKRGKEGVRVHSPESFIQRYEPEEGERIPSVRTAYRLIDEGRGVKTRNIDLPRKPVRKPKGTNKPRGSNVKKLGRSISERPSEVLDRKEMGHWEADLVMGKKGKEEPALLTLVERHSRYGIIIPVPNTDAQTILATLKNFLKEFSIINFKTITFDNGSEFSDVSELEEMSSKDHELRVYFAHAYSSWQRGTNENYNGLLREFIPKGVSISNYNEDYILQVEEALNKRPRKILDFKTAEEVFDATA